MTDRDHTSDDETSAYDIESRGVEYHPPSNANTNANSAHAPCARRAAVADRSHDASTSTRLLSCRVDALSIAYRVPELTTQTAKLVAARSCDAEEVGSAELRVGDFSFGLKATAKAGFVSFANNDYRGVYSTKASGGWTLEVVAQATRLATADLRHVIQEMDRIAQAFGRFADTPRLRRFDLAADFVGFPLLASDFASIQTTRARVVEYRRESGNSPTDLHAPSLRTHRAASTDITGFGISTGNVISGRIYDKTAELESTGDVAKSMIEHARWGNAGWNGAEQVTRVEFQHRGDFLDQTDLRNPNDLPDRLDSIWQRDVQWVRIIVPNSATRRHRGEVDARWLVVQGVVFEHGAEPAVRREIIRGGATVGQLLGALRSRLAASGRLFPLRSIMVNGSEVLDEQGYIEALTESQAEQWVHGHLAMLADEAVRECAVELGRKLGWRAAVFALLTQNNAVVARFSRADDPQRNGSS